MSKTTVKKSSAKPKKSTNKTVAAKSAPTVSKSAKASSTKVSIDKNVLLFLVLTLVLAGIMLIIQAQSNNTLSEQNKAQSALEYETDAKYDANQSDAKPEPAKP